MVFLFFIPFRMNIFAYMNIEKHIRYISLVLLLSLFVGIGPLALHSQSQHVAKQITNINGLPNNSINCFGEDARNLLWIGTWDGLCSYDGRDFRVFRYNRNDKGSIANNVIRQVVRQNSEYMWFSTNGGVSRWSEPEQKFDNFSPGSGSPQVMPGYLVTALPNGDIICCVRGEGYWMFNADKMQFEAIKSAASTNIVGLYSDRNGYMYTLTLGRKVERYSVGNAQISKQGDIEARDRVIDMSLSGDYLLLNYGYGIELVNTVDDTRRLVASPDNRDILHASLSENNLLLALANSGGYLLYNLDDKKYSQLEMPVSINSCFSLYAGSQNIFWIGTDGQGIVQAYRYTSPFRTVKSEYMVRSFARHEKGAILVGAKSGGITLVDKYSGNTLGRLSVDDGLISSSVYCMRKNTFGDIFVGTEGSGVNIIPKDSFKPIRLEIPSYAPFFKCVYSIVFTHNDSLLWLGTAGSGLIKISLSKDGNRYKATKVEKYMTTQSKTSLGSNTVFSIVQDNNPNILWVGTRGGGVNRYNIETGIFERISEDSLGNKADFNDILCLAKNDSNTLWVGSSYGLARVKLSGEKYTLEGYKGSKLVSNNTIHGILPDIDGNLWISTNQGLTHIDLTLGKETNYTASSGLQNEEFSDGAYFKDGSNTLYFGGISGFNSFNADDIQLRSFDPPIRLSNIRINNTDQNIAERLKDSTLYLSYNEAYVTLSFSVADFINNENCVYSYRIVGFDNQWIYNDTNPNVVITRLPPGKYTLEIQYTNGDRVLSSNIFELNLNIGYPWWFSTWAFICYAILLILVVYVSYSVISNRMKLSRQIFIEHVEKKNQQQMHESRLNFFTNIAHEFFTPLTLIYGPAQQLLESGLLEGPPKRSVMMIKNNAERMQQLLSELMEFRKAESGHIPVYGEAIDLKQFIEYVCDNYSEIAAENKISFDIETKNLSAFYSDRNTLEKIIFNLITNAFKYTPKEGSISILFTQSAASGAVSFVIRNTGKGLTDKQQEEIFDRFRIFESSYRKNTISTGIGLNLTREYVKLLGGEIRVESRLGEYVEFGVNLPPMERVELDLPDQEGDVHMQNEIQIVGNKDIRILVVDNEREIRVLLSDILSPLYNVSEANNGKRALEQIALNMPDIIISDIVMPEMDGISLIHHLKTDPKTAHIPIISISVKSSIEDKISAVEHGADAYIAKPFHPRHVLATINQIIERHSTLRNYFGSSRSSLTIRDGHEIHHEEEQFLDKIIDYIENNIDNEDLNPTSIAEAIGISKASLFEKLKQLTNRTPSEYVRLIRLDYASKLLRTTKLTVLEVMYKSGFSSKSYFYKEFSRQFDDSPQEYRKKMKTST